VAAECVLNEKATHCPSPRRSPAVPTRTSPIRTSGRQQDACSRLATPPPYQCSAPTGPSPSTAHRAPGLTADHLPQESCSGWGAACPPTGL
jgi:hypothetical protein